MTAPDQCCINVKKLLSIRRRPHMTHSGHRPTAEGPKSPQCGGPRRLPVAARRRESLAGKPGGIVGGKKNGRPAGASCCSAALRSRGRGQRWGPAANWEAVIVHLFHDLPPVLRLSRSAAAWTRSAVPKPSVN